MFFLARSAVCIALVVAACPDARTSSRPAAGNPMPGLVVTGAEKLCRARPARCLDLLRESLRMGSGEAYAALARAPERPSRDTLTAADRRAAWSGPVKTAQID